MGGIYTRPLATPRSQHAIAHAITAPSLSDASVCGDEGCRPHVCTKAHAKGHAKAHMQRPVQRPVQKPGALRQPMWCWMDGCPFTERLCAECHPTPLNCPLLVVHTCVRTRACSCCPLTGVGVLCLCLAWHHFLCTFSAGAFARDDCRRHVPQRLRHRACSTLPFLASL